MRALANTAKIANRNKNWGFLGRGEEQKDTDETAGRLGIKDNVVCRFDFVPEDERILHYAAADCCIFPSVYEPLVS